MENFDTIKAKAADLFAIAGFVSRITSEAEYEQALALMDELVEDYDNQLPLIEMLSVAIERWEEESESFAAFNRRIEQLDNGVSVLQTLIDQYELTLSDFEDEIGKKSLVSMILSGKRNLTVDHIQALSKRFGLSPAIFFGEGR